MYTMARHELHNEEIAQIEVLVAEDQHINRRVFERQFAVPLHKDRYHLTMVYDGLAAVAAVKANNYRIILMDQVMPGLTGIEAIRQIRALPDPQKRDIPIIIVSASPVDEKICAELGVIFMLKPYDMKKLFQNIEAEIANPPRVRLTATAVEADVPLKKKSSCSIL